MKAALYCRVSTDEQSTEAQGEELARFAAASGFEVVEIYDDSGRTGTNTKRPALQKMLNDVRLRKVDVIVCVKLDRLFRSLKDLVNTIAEWDVLGVKLVSIRDFIDLRTPAGVMLVQILGSFAQFEASLIRERTRAGLAAAKRRGVILGRKRLNREADVFRAAARGAGCMAISRELGVSPAYVSKTLKQAPQLKKRVLSTKHAEPA